MEGIADADLSNCDSPEQRSCLEAIHEAAFLRIYYPAVNAYGDYMDEHPDATPVAWYPVPTGRFKSYKGDEKFNYKTIRTRYVQVMNTFIMCWEDKKSWADAKVFYPDAEQKVKAGRVKPVERASIVRGKELRRVKKEMLVLTHKLEKQEAAQQKIVNE